MKKTLRYIIPIFLFVVIFIWGFVNINIVNTRVFNSSEQEFSTVNNDRIKDNIGMDLTVFSKDDNTFKIYREENKFILIYKNYMINLNEGLFGKALIGLVDFMNNSVEKLNMFVENVWTEY